MTLNGDYYIWLLDSIGVLYGEHENYLILMQHLFSTEYTYVFEMDGNRAMAGLNLRTLFSQETGVYADDVHSGPCSVLEMLIALADAIAFDTSENTADWFWQLIDNLGLSEFDDEHFDLHEVNHILEKWMNRQYDSSGFGSLFPIRHFDKDMRSMEVWDQKNAYLTTLHPVGQWLD